MHQQVVIIGQTAFDEIVDESALPGTISPNTRYRSGGKAFIASNALSRLGLHHQFVTLLGNDTNGDRARRELAKQEIDITHVRDCTIGRNGPVATPCVRLSEGINQERWAVLDMSDEFLRQYKEHLLDLPVAPWDVVLFTLELAEAITETATAIRIAREANPNSLVIGHSAPTPFSVDAKDVIAAASQVDILTMNRIEAAWLAGDFGREAQPIELVRALSDKCGVDKVIVTFGADGWAWTSPDGDGSAALPQVLPVDKIGASDVFVAGFIKGIVDQMPLPAAALFGGHAARIAVSRTGGTFRFPTIGEVHESFSNLSRI